MSSILFEKKRANINGFGARLATILVGLCLSFFWQGQPFLQQQLAREAVALHPWLPAGAFSAGVLVAALLSLKFIRLGDWRRLTLIAGLVSGLAFLAAGLVSGVTILLVCLALAGLFAGFGLSAAITCLGDTANPVGSFAGLLLVHGLVAVALRYGQPSLPEAVGFQQGLWALAALAFLAIPLSRLMPSSGTKRFSLLENNEGGLSADLLTALCGTLLLFLVAGVLWYLSGPLAQAMELHIGAAAMLGVLAARPLGALLIGLLGARLGYRVPVALAAILVLAALALLQFVPGETGYLAAFSLLGGAGFFVAPAVLGLGANQDRDGRYAPLLLAVPLLGLMTGHLVAGKLAGGQSPTVLWAGMAILWVVGSLMLVWAGKRS